SPSLPPELMDLIIAHIWPDKSTLSVCALVCRSWVVSARHQLLLELCVAVDTPTYRSLREQVVRYHSDTMAPFRRSTRHLAFSQRSGGHQV
ncbi:uncharacterized protein BXZ73DRAFT_20949, partial [Epithele typhae]|uniref:uncharacterized protein n=1 Tax=Epithele typhae TaxID=378194 RepID=UPI002007E5F5